MDANLVTESSHTWEIWRSSSSKALGVTDPNCPLDSACNKLLRTVKHTFGAYYPPDVEQSAFTQLREIFMRCVKFKLELTRQEYDYGCRQSGCQEIYSKDHMRCLHHTSEEEAKALISV